MTAFPLLPGRPRVGCPPAFEWSRHVCGDVLRCTALSAVTGNHGFTTRQLVLQGAERDCRAQWTLLADTAGAHVGGLVRLDQVHGATVSLIDGDADPGAIRRADAAITARHDVVLTVRAADCVPVLMADPESGAVAAVHAGWRGTAASIVAGAVAHLNRAFGADPARLVAALGPSVGPCCYSVGPELVDAFSAAGHGSGRWFSDRGPLTLDLWSATRDQLIAAGMRAEAVYSARLCTACHPELFYSYRREGAAAGRLVAFIRAARRP